MKKLKFKKFAYILPGIIFFFTFIQLIFISQLHGATSQEKKREIIEKYFMDGVNYYIARDFKNAAEMWKKVLDLEPTHKKARMYFEKAFEKYQTMQVNYYKGLREYKKGNCKKAIPFFKKTLLINPRHEKARHYLNLSYDCIKVRVKIVDKPSKDGKEIKDLEISTDDVIILYAIGFDGQNNYIGTIDVQWETTGTLDPIEKKEFSYKLQYAPTTFDTEGTIKAILGEGYSDETGKIVVRRGKLKYIKIMDAPNLEGKEITEIKMTTDQTLKLYAAGFDKNKVYIGDVPVNWRTKGELSPIKVEDSVEFVFSPTKAGVKGKIIAKSKAGPQAEITNISIKPGKLHYVRIEDAPDGKGKEVFSVVMTTDDVLNLYAVGYDAKDNFVANIPVNWETTHELEEVKESNSLEFSFSPQKANTKGSIKITKPGIIGDETGLIEVKPGAVSKIVFIKDKTYTITSNFALIISTPAEVTANGLDAKNNFVEMLKGTWSVSYENTNYIVATNSYSAYLEFTNIISNALLTFSNEKIQDTVSFDVIYPEVTTLKLLNATNNKIITNIQLDYNKSITLISGGFDAKGNYIKPIKCYWLTTGELDKFEKEYAETNIYIARTGDVKGEVILTNEELGRIRVGMIEVMPAPLVKKQVEVKNVVIYYVYNGDTLSKIISKLLRLPYKWRIVKKYVYAIGTYNKMKNVDLIFPRQPVYMPYFKVEKETTTEELALKIFGDRTARNRVIVYKKPWKKEITPNDKVIIRDVQFLSTGKLDIILPQDEIEKNQEQELRQQEEILKMETEQREGSIKEKEDEETEPAEIRQQEEKTE